MNNQPMPYPARESHFAHKFTRILAKSCAVMDLGHHATLLLIFVAHQEDAARYAGPVRFWNEQLMSMNGFSSPKQLTKAREAAINAGWLVYWRKTTRSVGNYFVRIPKQFAAIDDTPVEEDSEPEIDDATLSSGGMNGGKNESESFPSGNESGNESAVDSFPLGNESSPEPFPVGNESELILSPGGKQSGMNSGKQSGKLSNPNPYPIPKDDSAMGAEETTRQLRLCPAPLPSPDEDRVVAEWPCRGNPKTWNMRQSFVDKLFADYPEVDVLLELRKAWHWVNAKPERERKTARGMPAFFANWMNRKLDDEQPDAKRDMTWKQRSESSTQEALRNA